MIFEACLEMRSSIGYATFMVILAVVPIFFLAGVHGAFFQTVAYGYVLALIVSMIVAMTVWSSPYTRIVTPLASSSSASMMHSCE